MTLVDECDTVTVVHVGRCVGCNGFGRLHGVRNDACSSCLRRRRARFLELARRARVDSIFRGEIRKRLPEVWLTRFDAAFPGG
jgi:hypothetical protein